MTRIGLAICLLLPQLLGACALAPIYAKGKDSAAAEMLGAIAVPPIPDRAGYLVRQALLGRVGAAGEPAYRLEVVLDDEITGLGVRGDDSISRERRLLRARWRLVEIASGASLIDSTVRSDAGIDVVGSEYAVVAAEADALERLAVELADEIAARIALYARTGR